MTTETKKVSQEEKELQKLLEDSSAIKNLPQVGDLVEGEVLDISANAVLININDVATGVIRGYELYDESGESSGLKIGDKVSATVIELENENGEIELSFRKAGHEKAWSNLAEIQENEETIDVKVVNANKGGLMVKYNKISGFLPVSQLSQENYPRVEGGVKAKILEKLKELIGKKLKVKILNASKDEKKLIVSEKETTKEEVKKNLAEYNVGDIVDGVVSGVVDFGAFIKFDDGLEGLVHLSELAWKRIEDPRNVISVGDKVKAKIISIDGARVSFSIKQLKDDPWKEASEKYDVGQKVEGKIIKINPFGLFVELDKRIHGLCHVSEIPSITAASLREKFSEGDKVEFKILSIEPKEHRLGLSIKALDKKSNDKADKKQVSEDKEENTDKKDEDKGDKEDTDKEKKDSKKISEDK